jgi:two-component system, OmpR family, response regulator
MTTPTSHRTRPQPRAEYRQPSCDRLPQARRRLPAAPAAPAVPAGPVRVLVVDGGVRLGETLAAALGRVGWEVRGATAVAGAYRAPAGFRPDAVVADVRAPGRPAPGALERLRRELPGVPVLLLTGRITATAPAGHGLMGGPSAVEEAAVRLRSMFARPVPAARGEELMGAVPGHGRGAAGGRRDAGVPGAPLRLVVGDLELDEASREVRRGGRPVRLTATEFSLLRFLMRNPRRVLSKPQILDRVWSYDFTVQVNVVELYISYLRKKIDAGRPPMIHTRRGVGYVLRPAEQRTEPGARPSV